jgi:hypothetical protein
MRQRKALAPGMSTDGLVEFNLTFATGNVDISSKPIFGGECLEEK